MKNKILIFVLISLFIILFTSFNSKTVHAESLSENIENQLENIDLLELENFFNDLISNNSGASFYETIQSILQGEYNLKFENVVSFITSIVKDSLNQFFPSIILIITITILCVFLQGIKSSYLPNGVSEVVFFVCLLSIIIVLGGQVYLLYKNAKNIIENITKLTQIMSPIMLTLMIGSGGNVSASVYKPALIFFSSGVINTVNLIILPLLGIVAIFSLIASINPTLKLNKLSDGVNSIIKWTIGIIMSIYGLFLTVQGITSATFDGISIRATKYAISNSIPLIGSFLKDGFDLVLAGSIIIKNSVGIICLLALFFIILSPILQMVTFSLLLKITSGITEAIGESRISNLCANATKILTYLIVSILLVGFMLFLTILLILLSANSFV